MCRVYWLFKPGLAPFDEILFRRNVAEANLALQRVLYLISAPEIKTQAGRTNRLPNSNPRAGVRPQYL